MGRRRIGRMIMKNIFYHILSIAVVLSSLAACTIVEPLEPRSEDVAPEGKVSIYFGVNMAENGASLTKSMVRADTPKIERMYVAVFGGSHFLKEYVQAYPVRWNSSTNKWELGDWASTNGNSTTYYFRADLTPSNSSGMHLHFIANGPTYLDFDYENTVISNALTEAGADVGAYWQMMTVDGIKASSHDNPSTGMTEYDKQNVPVSASNTIETYVWSDATASQFATPVVLVRNFAKIKVVDEAPDFTLKAYALVNTPAQGAVAPYNSNTDSFMSDYYTFHYSGLKDVYPGRLPAGVAINGISTLTESHFTDNSIYPEVVKPSKAGESKDGLYVYERPAVNISQGNPTYIVLYGTYSGQDYFYRVDLSDDTNSNIIFRNFQYTITVSGISRPGSTHLSDDMTSAGDISSTTPSTLSEVSNGESKLWVQTTERLLINHPYDTVKVKIKYYPDGSTIDNSLLTFDYTPQRDEYAVIKEDASVDKQYISLEGTNTTDDCYLVFTRNAASAVKQRQSVTIYGNKNIGGTLTPTLFRTIDFIQWQQQTFVVTCTPEVLREKNKPVAVNIYLPLGLERSMFPLNINIMADKFSLSPASGESLPVEVGNIATGNAVRGFYYVKTIDTYEDYLTLAEESVMVNGVSAQRKKIVCNFVTNKEKSASRIYVTAKNFVDNSQASFVDYKLHEFTDTHFSSTETTINRPVVLYFDMDNDADADEAPHSGKYVTVDLSGLRLDPSHATENQVHFASLTPDDAGYYKYDPAGNPSGVIYLLTGESATSTSFDGTYGATLSAHHYVTADVDQNDVFTTITGSYTLTFNNDNYTSNTINGDNGINFQFTNCEGGGNNNNSRYKAFGNRSYNWGYTYNNGLVTISAPTIGQNGKITGITITYSGGYDDQTVTFTPSGSDSTTTSTSAPTSWTGVATTNIVITMNCNNSTSYNNRNRVRSIKVDYEYRQ